MNVTEITINAPNQFALLLPDDTTIGTELVLTARVRVRSLDEEQIDVTNINGDQEVIPGNITVEARALYWEANA